MGGFHEPPWYHGGAGDLAKQFLLRGKLLKQQPSWKDFDYDMVQPQMGKLIAEDLWRDENVKRVAKGPEDGMKLGISWEYCVGE